MVNTKNQFNTKVILFLVTCLLSACNHSTDKTEHQAQAQRDNGWKIGAKIHFEEESDDDYIGLKEVNSLTREALKSILNVQKESGDNSAKLLLKKENGKIQIEHYTEKGRINVGEEMHATLLYTSPRGFHPSETLAQVCNVLFADCGTSPEIVAVSRKYSAIIEPSWRFKISEIVITKSDQGPSFIMAIVMDRQLLPLAFTSQ